MKLPGLCATAFFAASCVSQPVPSADMDQAQPLTVASQPALAQPVRKERLEHYTVPVILKETVSFADGLVDKIARYTYDDGFIRLLSTVSKKPSSANALERISYEYSGKTLMSKSIFGPDSSLLLTYDYLYGSDGELIKETALDGKSAVQSISEWTWSDGRKTTWRVMSGAGIIRARTEYSYEGDRLVAASLLDGSGAIKSNKYMYTDGDTLIQIQYFNAAGSQDGRIDYVLQGSLVEQENVYRADGRLERSLSYEYGPDGALIKKTLADAAGRAREITVYENAYRAETRIIVYYE